MFSSKARRAQEAATGLDFSQLLKDRSAWNLGHLATLGIGGELTAWTFVGTQQGKLFVFGAPGVQLGWDVGIPSKIRHLAFKAGSGFLCIVDAKDTLYVFDLNRIEKGRPHRDSMLSLHSNVTCVETSASHSFLFIGGRDGTVDVFDLDRGTLASHARVPNLWLAQEEILRRSGIPDAPSRRHIPVCTDVKTHPLDLNLLLIAYEGGVSMWNLATRQCERNWEFVVPPGAPGGGNDSEATLFQERRPPVTCLAWRPDGLVFAAGHEDGTISFASSSDEMPLVMRTLERADVNKTTEEDLFGWSSQGGPGHRQPANREPIFRLAWSGFPEESYLDRAAAAFAGVSSPTSPSSPVFPGSPSLSQERVTNGSTILTVLGGLLPSDPVGIHLLELPAYVPPPATATTSKPGIIPLPLREALRESLSPVGHHLYPTASPPEDFLLLPRSSPHYGLAYDPTSILISSGLDRRFPVLAAPHASINIEAWTFPPSSKRPPRLLSLPTALSFSGGGTCSSAQLVTVSGLSYRKLLHQFDVSDEFGERLPLTGGSAFPQPRTLRPTNGPASAIANNHPRLLITLHIDLVVRFWDISSHLLWGYKASEAAAPRIALEYPRPLRHLDVDVKAALRDGRVSDMAAARLLNSRSWELELDKVSFAEENLELAVSLSTGDLVVWRWAYGEHPAAIELDRVEAEATLDDTVQEALRDMSLDPADYSAPSIPPVSPRNHSPPHHPDLRRVSSPHRSRAGSLHGSLSRHGRNRTSSVSSTPTFHSEMDPQDHYVDLRDAVIPRPDLDGFRPIAGFKFASSSEAGAPSTKTCLALADVGFLAASNEANLIVVDMRGPEVVLVDSPNSPMADIKGKGKQRPDSSSITSLTWTISPIGEDHDHSPRLIVTQESGLTRVFELANLGGSWHLSEQYASFHHDSTRGAFSTFVLDKFGGQLRANAQGLQHALNRQASFSVENLDPKGSLTSLWVTAGPRALAVFFNVDGPKLATYEDDTVGFERAIVVGQQDCSVLVVQARNRQISVFSLPDLVQIHRMSFEASVHDSAGDVCLCEDGDLLQYLDPLDIRLHTTRDINRPAFPPRLALIDSSIPIPAQTSALAYVGSALGSWFGGAKIYTGAEMDSILGGPNRPPPKNRPLPGAPPPIIAATKKPRAGSPAVNQQQFIQGATDSAAAIMAATNQALEQRGEYLGYIQERLGSMADDASRFVSETKRSAQREAGKASLRAGFASLWKKVP
ncbi:hypothetical protein JCM1841_002666 [Sporobolomyces salmonicolor]